MFARSKSSASTSLDNTTSDPNENIPINLPDRENDAPFNQIDYEKRKLIDEQKNSLNIPISHNNSNSSKSILTKETLEAIQATEQIDKNPTIEQTIAKEKSFAIESSSKPEENGEIENEELKLTLVSVIIETELPTESDKNSTENQPTFKNQTMDNVIGGAVSNIGDSIMSDIKSIAAFGEEKLNNLDNETEMAINEVAELPENNIDYVKTSINADDKNDDELKANINEEKGNSTKDLPKQLTEPKLSMREAIATLHDDDSSPMQMDKMKQNNKLNRGMAEDNTSVTGIDNEINNIDGTLNTDVKFIDNGVDILNTTNIIQVMKDEMNEMSNDVKNKADELTMKYDGIVNDKLDSSKEMVSNKLLQVKNGWLRNEREFSNIGSSPLILFLCL